MKRKGLVTGLAAAVVALAGCSSITTQADEAAVRYEGGALWAQAPEFKRCQGPSQQEYGDPGDGGYTYPAGERTFKFGDGGDAPALQVTARGGVTLSVTGVVTFKPGWMNPDNTVNCERLREFHERVGLKFRQNAGGDNENQWWIDWMATYVAQPVDRAADTAALNFDWAQLANDGQQKEAWETQTKGNDGTNGQPKSGIPLALDSLGPDAQWINIVGVLLQKPTPPGEVTTELNRNEAAKLAANTAATDQQAAQNFPGGIAGYTDYQQQKSINKAIEDGKVQVVPIPFGSDVNVNVAPPQPR